MKGVMDGHCGRSKRACSCRLIQPVPGFRGNDVPASSFSLKCGIRSGAKCLLPLQTVDISWRIERWSRFSAARSGPSCGWTGADGPGAPEYSSGTPATDMCRITQAIHIYDVITVV